MYIPKIIHQICIDPESMNDDHASWRQSWIHHNPEWFMILWDKHNIAKFNSKYTEIISNCKNRAEISDILRIEILYRIGGLYVDIDFECLKPIDPLLENRKFLYVRHRANRIGNAIMASTPGAEYISLLHDRITDRYNSHGTVHNSAHKFGPGFLTSLLPRSATVSKDVAYPYDWSQRDRKTEDFKCTCPDAYAVHHWDQHWK